MSYDSYKRLVTSDMKRWVAMGWVTPDNAEAIIADLPQSKPGNKIATIIGILGAILLAAGVVLFVSANWQEISKLGRMLLIISAMWGAFGFAVWLKKSTHDYMSEAMMGLGAAIFGANIMLIAQMYHIEGRFPDAFLFWAVGALLAVVLLQSRLVLVLAFGLIAIWAGSEIFDYGQKLFWPFLPVWAVAAVLAWWLSFRFAIHLAFLSFMAWLFTSLEQLIEISGLGETETGALLVMFIAGLIVAGYLMQAGNWKWTLGFGGAMANYAICCLLLIGFVEQLGHNFLPDNISIMVVAVLAIMAVMVIVGSLRLVKRKVFNPGDAMLFSGFCAWFILFFFVKDINHLWLLAGVYLGFIIWLLIFAQRRSDGLLVALALLAFAGQVLYIYMETLGTLLDTSLFFLLGGVLLVVLAFGLEMLRRYLERNGRLEGAG